MKPETRTIRARSHDDYTEVQAAVYGGVLALHRLVPGVDKWGWTVTHVPTGATVYNPQLQRDGKGFILAALDAGKDLDWDWDHLTRENAEVLRELILRTPAPPPAPNRDLGGLTADWLPGFVPSEALQAHLHALDRAWRNGDDAKFAAHAAAFTALEHKELIVARMATGKRAILLPTDVREGAPSVNGILCDLPTFKALFRELWAIGDRIEDVAGRMQGLIAVGEPDGKDEDEWVRLDQELTGLICEGWMKWSSAAYVFATLGPQEQAPFLKRLGFLGSTQKGWHALGKKSFLRSERLRQILPMRREIRRRNGNYGE